MTDSLLLSKHVASVAGDDVIFVAILISFQYLACGQHLPEMPSLHVVCNGLAVSGCYLKVFCAVFKYKDECAQVPNNGLILRKEPT